MNIRAVELLKTKRSFVKKSKSAVSKGKKRRLTKLINLTEEEKDILYALKSLSDLTKFKILLLLQKQKLVSVKDIAEILKISPSATSHALADLKMLDLVECERCGKQRCYSLSKSKKGKKIIKFLDKIL